MTIIFNLFNYETSSGAIFSSCRTWRYQLWRTWDDGPSVAFIGLNPSLADETRNDNTKNVGWVSNADDR